MNTTAPFGSFADMPAVPVRAERYTPKDWDAVRMAFGSSILVDTPLASLAQNLEGRDWPLKGRDETPASYIDLSFAEMRERLALNGQPPRTGDFLISLLKETLAFDDPFGDMVTQSEAGAERENPIVKNLQRLGIPEDFPVTLTSLSSDTILFCQLEGIVTLREFAMFAQRMAQSVIVGGDFRALLNALSSIDERVLGEYLPFRVGSKGVHYIESLSLAVQAQPASIQAAFARSVNYPLTQAATDLADTVAPSQVAKARETVLAQAAVLRGFCADEYAVLQKRIAEGANLSQLVAVLGDPLSEAVVADLLKPVAVRRPKLHVRILTWLRT